MNIPDYAAATLTNEIADRIPTKLVLIQMWEDSALDDWEEAEEKARWLAENLSNRLVIIRTGMPIIATCEHPLCGYYDALYSLLIVPIEVWNTCKSELLAANEDLLRQWSQCQHPHLEPALSFH